MEKSAKKSYEAQVADSGSIRRAIQLALPTGVDIALLDQNGNRVVIDGYPTTAILDVPARPPSEAEAQFLKELDKELGEGLTMEFCSKLDRIRTIKILADLSELANKQE